MENKKNYYAVIPAEVRYSKNLKPNEKLMYGELTALANDKGYCYASNLYFSNLYNAKKNTISRWVSNLAKNGFIDVKLIYKKGTKQIEERHIYLCDKKSIGIVKKEDTPIGQKGEVIYNITNINNIKKNIPQNLKTPLFNDIITKAFPHFVALFPVNYRPKTKAQEIKWLECLDKIQRIDKYDLRDVYNVAKELREDQFWSKNFLSILKFRNTDKNGIKFIDRFINDYNFKNKPKCYYKIKGIIEYYLYKSPANGQMELGAKTKGGELFEFNIKQTLQTNEFQALKKYVQDGNK